MSPTFRSLKNSNYRLWATGALVSNTGTWMQRVAQDWLVLTALTHNSGLAVGITTGLQFVPVLVLAPVAGTVADRLQRRRVLIGTQTALGVLAGVLGLLVVFHLAQLWHVYVLALLLGVVGSVDAPARQAFVSELVPAEDLPNAVGLNSASFHAGRLIGPGLAGLLIHWLGTGPVFLINAATFGAVLLSLTRMRVDRLIVSPRVSRSAGTTRAGLAYVRHRPDIVLILVIVGMVGTFGLNFQLTTALMARLVFHAGSGGYGLLGSVMAVGSLAGALLAARREHPTPRLVVAATAAFGVTTAVAALMPTYPLFALALIPVGLSSLTLMTAANATVQLSTAPQLRGRVMALYLAVFMGGTPLGAPLIGWVGERFGARWTILIGSFAALLTAAGAALWMAHQARRAAGPPPWEVSTQVQGSGEQVVADEAHRVEQGVRDHQGHHPAPAPEVLPEDQAHHGVAEERPEALVQVVRAAQHGARAQDRPPRPGQFLQPGDQVADHDDLFDESVLRRLQQQDGNRPPVGVQPGGHHGGGDPELMADDVQGQPRHADRERQQHACATVPGGTVPVQADPVQT